MRVYEFSKKYNVPNKELIDALQAAGYTVKNHMSVLENEALELLLKKFNSLPEKQVTQSEQPPMQQKNPVPAKSSHSKSKTPPISEKTSHYVSQKRAVHQKKVVEPESPTEIVLESMTVGELADRLVKPVNEIILMLLKSGVMSTKNQMLTEEQVKKIADFFEIATKKPELLPKSFEKKLEAASTENLKERAPIIVVLGHVDHGKTSLLDFIRKTRVAAREKGGITQHLGAYEAVTKQGNLIFLDTPGHEAFSKMRARGVRTADIAILVVAADDGVMPQTVEAIKHAQDMGVPIIVAINKMDKADPQRVEVVKRQLSQHGLLPEEWGGDVVCVPISAKTGQGIDDLLDMLVLQSQMMELRADYSGSAKGYVLESRLEKGRGPVATLIAQHGNMQIGDYILSGATAAKITSLIDSAGKRIMRVGPATPVQVAGFEELPAAGDFFEVVDKETFKQHQRAQKGDKKGVLRVAQSDEAINLIIKSDTNSSREALVDSLNKLVKKYETGFNIVHTSVGPVTEGDVELAYSTGADIICLHTKPETSATRLAQMRGVTIVVNDIIYRLLEYLEERLKKEQKEETTLAKIGEARVLKVFDIKGVGVVAGSIVLDGRFSKDGSVVAWRGKQKIGEGKITSLQREKRTVKEVHAGFECGFVIEGINDWEPDDRVECFLEVPVKK